MSNTKPNFKIFCEPTYMYVLEEENLHKIKIRHLRTLASFDFAEDSHHGII